MSIFGLLGWWRWFREQLLRTSSDNVQEERWFLQILHSQDALDELAEEIARKLRQSGTVWKIQVESLWVDGLPQAVGWNGNQIKCELADLLYVVRASGLEKAILLQGKTSENFNELPSSGSTSTERELLETHDWVRKIELYSNYKGTKSIGNYKLMSTGIGLKPFASYLLIAKEWYWRRRHPFVGRWSPYITGWPQSFTSTFLNGATSLNLVDLAVDMAQFKSLEPGHLVDNSNTEWKDMVDTLRGRKAGVSMRGYGGQPYLRRSIVADSSNYKYRRPLPANLMRRISWLFPSPMLSVVPVEPPGGPPPALVPSEFDAAPLIPTITVTFMRETA